MHASEIRLQTTRDDMLSYATDPQQRQTAITPVIVYPISINRCGDVGVDHHIHSKRTSSMSHLPKKNYTVCGFLTIIALAPYVRT